MGNVISLIISLTTIGIGLALARARLGARLSRAGRLCCLALLLRRHGSISLLLVRLGCCAGCPSCLFAFASGLMPITLAAARACLATALAAASVAASASASAAACSASASASATAAAAAAAATPAAASACLFTSRLARLRHLLVGLLQLLERDLVAAAGGVLTPRRVAVRRRELLISRIRRAPVGSARQGAVLSTCMLGRAMGKASRSSRAVLSTR
jgi:hypothetical protein